ncbi:hypothetical protein CathTA2_1737 [Caldalkalibacillus thermarum TA2.A1]|uniref:Zinc ribbon domain-containing protein n=1 Tax=Caldalkalibacillus thermarum (strain TA2.A1) TaxID=986075 RepID=F5L7D7_CALTT|nr:zinc ribbon domain-containing protein [Caldalkalibacillus thermarum]EGL82729.1 hypothetical protein CathTA2_1737 [Caldalkalibacillus thermarum TA2.A1]QZT32570.1 zinc ribbon domain-containing protein [Caldalkalibacillus thermarum TA2.A1]
MEGERMKVEYCIRCGRQPDEKDQYCTHCGAPLQNKCTNDGGPLGDPCNKVNHPQAAFCAQCGSPTVFKKTGLIMSPYEQGTKAEIDDLDELKHFSHRFFKDT